MKPLVDRLAVLGLGLLGGSVALAAKRRGVAACVVGAGRRRHALEAARARGVVDEVADFETAVRGADLVVLATPVHAMPEILRRVAPQLAQGAVVTDVGSVKAPLADTLPGLLPQGVAYVGSHPLAGSHLRGVEHARSDLLEGAPCAVTPTAAVDRASVERVAEFWRRLGARVVQRDPAAHDAEVSWTSHVPHVLAFAFARALASAPSGTRELLGPGFRDFTRIGQSDSEIWSDILTANRKAIAGPLQSVASAVASLAAAIEANDAEAVEEWVAAAREVLGRMGAAATGRTTPDPGAKTRKSRSTRLREDPERKSKNNS